MYSPILTVLQKRSDSRLCQVCQQFHRRHGHTTEEHQTEAEICDFSRTKVPRQQDESFSARATTETSSAIPAIYSLPTGMKAAICSQKVPVYSSIARELHVE